MSYEEYATNQDPVLETALSFDDDNFVLDPMDHMTNLFLSGNIEQLKTDATRMLKDPKYRFFNFESEFNKAGYQLLQSGQTQEAIFVFQMTAEFFPNSANAWDSLAEGFLKAGDKAKATEYYTKAIKMDPKGPTGRNASEMLRSIEQGNH